jgi:hypothetical protein
MGTFWARPHGHAMQCTFMEFTVCVTPTLRHVAHLQAAYRRVVAKGNHRSAQRPGKVPAEGWTGWGEVLEGLEVPSHAHNATKNLAAFIALMNSVADNLASGRKITTPQLQERQRLLDCLNAAAGVSQAHTCMLQARPMHVRVPCTASARASV